MSTKLRTRQLRAIHLLARGMTGAEVARQMRLRPETLSRWKKNPLFCAEFERVMGELREGMQHRLTSLVDASITSVKSEISRAQSDPKRVQTALNVLKLLGIEKIVVGNAPKPEGK